MGARNVQAAYRLYAGKVPPLSMQILVYMALVSKDSDAQPWYSQGHAALAEFALGRSSPVERRDLVAVERAIVPLVKAGAITVGRKGAPRTEGPRTTLWRLHLAQFGEAVTTRNSCGEDPTDSVSKTTRFPVKDHTDSVQSPHGNRVPEETGGGVGAKGGVDGLGPQPSTGRAHGSDEDGFDDDRPPADDVPAYLAWCREQQRRRKLRVV